jgi:glycosyltransferase involved in cell wall biosynthesis
MKILYYTTSALHPEGIGGLHSRQFGLYKILLSRIQNGDKLDLLSDRGFYSLCDTETVSELKNKSSLIDMANILCHRSITGKNRRGFSLAEREVIKSYDLVICSYINTAQNLIDASWSPPIICDMVDSLSLHYHEFGRALSLRGLLYRYSNAAVRSLETRVIRRARAVFVTTEHEKAWLTNTLLCDADKIAVLPNGVNAFEVSEVEPSNKASVSRELGFIGTLDYYPNVEAVRFLCEKIAPSLKLHGCKIKLVGADPLGLSRKYKSVDNVEFVGRVKDIKDAFSKVQIMLLPLRVPSGIQNKLLSSLAMGKVAIIPERMVFSPDLVTNRCVVPYKDNDDVAEKVLEIINNPTKAHEIACNAHRYAKTKLTWDALGSFFWDRVKPIYPIPEIGN